MNNPDIQGVYVPPGVETAATEAPPPPLVSALPPAISSAPAQLIITDSRPVVQKLFFTGRLQSGKDTSANAAGATIFGFADPIYRITSHLFKMSVTASEGKDLPGMREFLQTIGQWGRGVVNEQYPITPVRALFCQQICAQAENFGFFPEVAWNTFGSNPDIWLNACIARADEYLVANPGARVAITNVRFENEFKRLQAEDFQHWHCMCSAKTWTERLAQSKLTPESPAVKDLSEQLAIKLDASVIKLLSAQKLGPQLRAIWSDKQAPKPSERLHSTESFLLSIGGVQ